MMKSLDGKDVNILHEITIDIKMKLHMYKKNIKEEMKR